jgi:hypothetical protein
MKIEPGYVSDDRVDLRTFAGPDVFLPRQPPHCDLCQCFTVA